MSNPKRILVHVANGKTAHSYVANFVAEENGVPLYAVEGKAYRIMPNAIAAFRGIKQTPQDLLATFTKVANAKDVQPTPETKAEGKKDETPAAAPAAEKKGGKKPAAEKPAAK